MLLFSFLQSYALSKGQGILNDLSATTAGRIQEWRDYFYASNFTQGLNPGLWDSYVGIIINGSNKVSCSSNLHYFAMTADINNPSGFIPKTLGVELDLQFDWNIQKNVRLSYGYSSIKGTNSMSYVKGGNHTAWQDWGWISLNTNPQILFVRF